MTETDKLEQVIVKTELIDKRLQLIETKIEQLSESERKVEQEIYENGLARKVGILALKVASLSGQMKVLLAGVAFNAALLATIIGIVLVE